MTHDPTDEDPNPERMIDQLTTLLETSTGRADIGSLYMQRAKWYIQTSQFDRSTAEYESAIDLLVDNADIAEAKAMIALNSIKNNNFREACYWSLQAVELAPNNPSTHSIHGLVCFSCKMPNLAISSFRTALDLDPGDPDTVFELARVLNSEKRFSEAIELIRQFGDETSLPPVLLYSLARSHLQFSVDDETKELVIRLLQNAKIDNSDALLGKMIERQLASLDRTGE